MDARWISCADTAKLLRQALKGSFPSVKFSVRSKTHSGGASINVDWTDGPLAKNVEAVAKHYAGCTFDGMIDLKGYHASALRSGEVVHFGANFVFCHRNLSPAFQAQLLAQLSEKFGQEIVGDRFYPFDVREQCGELFFTQTDRSESGWTLLHRLSVYA